METYKKNLIDFMCHSFGNNEKQGEFSEKTARDESYKLIYIYSGNCTVDIDGKSYALEEGCSFVAFPYSRFRIYNSSGLRYCWIEFSGFEVTGIMGRIAITQTHPVVRDMNVEHFEELFDLGERSEEPCIRWRVGGRIMVLMSYYMERYPGKTMESTGYVIKARRYIEDHYTDPEFGVKNVAERLKIDRSHLYRLFKDEMGISVIDYIIHRRIACAEILLSNAALSVKDVAYSCGFSDQMYFSRVFKKTNGHTPTQFRENVFSHMV